MSGTLDQVDWHAELVRGDQLENAVQRPKQQPDKGLFLGGVKLPLALAEPGLIEGHQPADLRHHVEAAGDDRVGVTEEDAAHVG